MPAAQIGDQQEDQHPAVDAYEVPHTMTAPEAMPQTQPTDAMRGTQQADAAPEAEHASRPQPIDGDAHMATSVSAPAAVELAAHRGKGAHVVEQLHLRSLLEVTLESLRNRDFRIDDEYASDYIGVLQLAEVRAWSVAWPPFESAPSSSCSKHGAGLTACRSLVAVPFVHGYVSAYTGQHVRHPCQLAN